MMDVYDFESKYTWIRHGYEMYWPNRKKSLEVKDYQKNSPLKLLMKYTLTKTTVFYGKNNSRHSRLGHFRKNVTSRVAKTTSSRFEPNKKVSVKKVRWFAIYIT